jgi:uncharacterized protein (TIGR00251 family)
MPIIQVKVKPNAKTSHLEEQEDGTFVASIKSPPVDGKANTELIALIARQFGVPKSCVTIKTGQGSRLKRVHVSDP